MAKRNIIYTSKYEREVGLLFVIAVFFIILLSGCMRDLQPSLDPILPEWKDNPQVQGCCAQCDQEKRLVADTMRKAQDQRPTLVRLK